MNWKQSVPLNQGSTKTSEVVMDTETPIFQAPVHTSTLAVLEQLIKSTSDTLRKQAYFLRSEGKILWDGNDVRLDESGLANNIVLDFLHTENPSTPAISLVIQGTIGTPDATTFKDLTVDDGEILWLELDTNVVLSSGPTVIIENAINGGSLVSGKTLRKGTSVPTMTSPVDQSPNPTPASTTCYIPLCYRKDTNIMWIPHGITWLAGTSSLLGAVLAEGSVAYPERFADSEIRFEQAYTELGLQGGGVILLIDSFGITKTHTIPDNIKIMGRGNKIELSFVNEDARLVLGTNCELCDFKVITTVNFGNTAILMADGGKKNIINRVTFDMSQSQDVSGFYGPYDDFNDVAVKVNKFNNGQVSNVIVQPDGKILISGYFTNYGGISGRNYLIRLNSDYTVDSSFCSNASDGAKFSGTITSMALRSDGKIALGGTFITYPGGTNLNRLILLNPDGTLDAAFTTNCSGSAKFGSSVFSIAFQPDDKLLVGGGFVNHGSVAGRSYFIRFNTDGTVDTSFTDTASGGSKFNNSVRVIKMKSDGKILVGGSFTSYSGVSGRGGVIQVNPDGTLDTAFTANSSDGHKFTGTGVIYVVGAAVQPDGKVLVSGDFESYNGVSNVNKLVRLNSDGTLDTAFTNNSSSSAKFGSGVGSSVLNVEVNNAGNILAGGTFNNYDGTIGTNYFVALNPDGTTNSTITNNISAGGKLNSQVVLSTVQPDDSIYLGGNYTNYDGITGQSWLTKFGSDGTIGAPVLIASSPVAVTVSSNHNRLRDCWFIGVDGATYITGIDYTPGYINNSDVDSLFE